MLLIVQESLQGSVALPPNEEDCCDPLLAISDWPQSLQELDLVACASLHCFRLCNSHFHLEEDFEYWVKPRSTAWFSRFVLDQYDDKQWVQHFRMTKVVVLRLSNMLSPHVKKRNTNYLLVVPVIVRVACTLFKLAQGASLTICSELFAVGVSTVSGMIYDVVRAINVVLREEISWPRGYRLLEVQCGFHDLCGLPDVVGAIDGTHIHIANPAVGAQDYFYFKTHRHSLNCQAVVDNSKHFLDLYLGMPGLTNDARILSRLSLYQLAMSSNLFDNNSSVDGFAPYLLGDSGYPLLHWLMTPIQNHRNPTVLESLYNRKLRRGRCVVENAFGILKKSWCELLHKTELDVKNLLDVILCCAILHNLLLGQDSTDIARLLGVLQAEGWREDNLKEEDGTILQHRSCDSDVGEHPTGANV